MLIVAGSLVGASGLILTIIMAKAMNRSITNILFVGYASPSTSSSSEEQGEVSPISVGDAYLILESASSVLICPGLWDGCCSSSACRKRARRAS